MKKLVFVFVLLIYVPFSVCAKELWTKIENNIFVAYGSVKKEELGHVGWFKIVEPQKQLYRLEKYKAYCSLGVIEVQHIQIFNDNEELIKEEINDKKIGCEYSGILNGDVYFRTLCNRKKVLFNSFLKISFFR